MLFKLRCQFVSMTLGLICVLTFASSCSSTKYINEEDCLLKSSTITCENQHFNTKLLEPYFAQRPNSKWFSLVKLPLGIYNMSGRDSTKWINRTLKRIGEKPIVFDSIKTIKSCDNMISAMKAMGYLQANATYSVTKKNKKATVQYKVFPGTLYLIDSIKYVIEDDALQPLLEANVYKGNLLKKNMPFSTSNLDVERKRIAQFLLNNGYYKFNKDFIHYVVDTIGKNNKVNVELHLIKYRSSNNSPETPHKHYYINNINFRSGDSKRIPLRKRVLANNVSITPNAQFCSEEVQNTYNNFARLQAVRFTNIHFEELPDTNLLDCNVQISTRKPNSLSFQPEGTNTAGDFGAAASLTYTNNNLFRGSETFSIQLRGAYEAIKGLEWYQNENYIEYNIETKLAFPRIIAPFLSGGFRKRNHMKSELLFSYNMQNRPEFHRRVLTAAWRYHWGMRRNKTVFRYDFLDINYVHMPWISSTFKKEYLDDVSNRNAILRYNYEDLFILRTGLNFSFSDSKNALRSNIEIGGNLLYAISNLFGEKRNSQNQFTLFKIAYAQYVKGYIDYTRLVKMDIKNTLAMHFRLGVAYPYGNSTILPFEKRYFSGGANSVRGWNVRALGPGKFKGKDGRIDFINQTGDIKLDMNMELRTFLFWKFNCAFFVDAGNIWTIKDYKDQPGGQFKFNEFYKQIAVGYGFGLRLNLDYFIMRVDLGMKAVNPAYETRKEHYPITNPHWNDLTFHFAVGMPF